jgi:tetratricopeptide (TPR) repeat protein
MKYWLALGLALLLAGAAQAQLKSKNGYNVWAKEKIRYLNGRIIRDPYNPRLRVLLANAYIDDGRKFDAKKELHYALELDSTFAEAYCNLGIVLHTQGYGPEAQMHYEKALALDSMMVEARAGLGTLLCRSEHQAEGLEHLEKVVLMDPDHLNARYNMAVAYHKVGDFKKAIEHLEILFSIQDDFPGARNGLARAYYSLGLLRLQAEQGELALESLTEAVRYEQSNGNMFFAKGLAHLESEDLVGAEQAFKRTIEIEIDYIPALHNLGTIYERQGRLDEAEAAYLRVQELAPHMSTIEAVKHTTYDVKYLVK